MTEYTVLMPAGATVAPPKPMSRVLLVATPVVAVAGIVSTVMTLGITTRSMILAVWLVVGSALALRVGILSGRFRARKISMIDARMREGQLEIGVFQGYLRLRRWLSVPKGSTVKVTCEGDEAPYALAVTVGERTVRTGSTIEWNAQSRERLNAVAKAAGVRVSR